MTDRNLEALSSLTHGGSRYYEPHLTTSASKMTTKTVPTATTIQATMEYQQEQQQALQQRLLYQQQKQAQQQQEQRYYASSYQLHRSYAQNYANQQSHHSSYLGHQHTASHYIGHTGYPHYDATTYSPYHDRLFGSGSTSYNRLRYSPYHHQLQQQHQQHHHQSLHGLYTAAGQQLIPSSVLHYPPKNNSSYQIAQQQSQQQRREEQMLLQHQFQHHLVPNKFELEQQQQRMYEQQQLEQRTFLHNLNDPYRLSQNHYQQAQMSILSTQQLQLQLQEQQNSCLTPCANEILPQNSPSHTLSAECCQISPNKSRNRNGECHELHQQQHRPPETSSADCITTSPPLISATGTDSGISSSGARNDSTQSTPVYSSEYPPLSVGSSSGVSYHFADGKELEEPTNVNKEVTTVQKDEKLITIEMPDRVNQELVGNCQKREMHCITKPIIRDLNNGVPFDAENDPNQNGKEPVCTKFRPPPSTFNDDNKLNKINKNVNVCLNSPKQNLDSQLSSNGTGSSFSTNFSSPINKKNCTAQFAQTAVSNAFQDKKQQDLMSPTTTDSTNQIKTEMKDTWSPFPNSPNCWTQSCSPKCDAPTNAQMSPPTVPAPPHNSPVDYQPREDPIQLFSEITIKSSNKKNIRNRQHDVSTMNKKTKFKRSVLGVGKVEDEEIGNDQHEELREITPLPGFQQAFGSTEIGRFSETFLLTPDDCNSTEQHYGYDENQQQQPIDCFSSLAERCGASQNSWASFDPYLDYANSAQMQHNMRYTTAAHGLGYRTYDRNFGLREAMLMSERFSALRHGNTNFNEIRCNGY